MARNRFLFDFIGLIAFFASAVPAFLFAQTDGFGAAGIWGGSIFGGALLLGFFAYKNDGVKIAAILTGIIALGGIIIGVLMIVGGTSILDSIGDLGELIFSVVFGPIMVVVGIILIIAVIIVGGISIGIAAIGSAIGEAVWKDKTKNQKFTATPGQTYVPAQDAYQPVVTQTPQTSTGLVCKNCSTSNPAGDKFCTNCGAKL